MSVLWRVFTDIQIQKSAWYEKVQGKNVNGKERPNNIDKLCNIKIYTVLLADHKNYYEFEDPDDPEDNFFLNHKRKFIPRTEASIKPRFFLENTQPALFETRVLINNVRHW